jgi:hypothetical protein
LAATLPRHDWDICYLGFTDPKTPFKKLENLDSEHDLWRVSGCNTAHAYLARSTVYDWLLDRLPTEDDIWSWLGQHRAVDRWYYRNLSRRFNVLAISPSVVNQRPGVSDITQRRNNGDHVTAIDGSRASSSGFALRNTLRHVSWLLAEPRDWLRGQIKRQRGF